MKRSFHGPFWCHLCRNNEENTDHLFLHCPIITEQWNLITASSPSLHRWQGRSIMEAWLDWLERHKGRVRNLPLLMCWAIWTARNRAIFDRKDPLWPTIRSHILADFSLLPEHPSRTPSRTIQPELIDKAHPWAFFDGSAQEEGCGGGGILYLRDNLCYKIQMNLGRGTNNFVELSTAKHLIHFALEKHCTHLQLFGDSKLVCNWLNRTSHCFAFTLRHILDEAHMLSTSFDKFVCQHIYREHNTGADYLSKNAVRRQEEDWLIQEEVDGTFHQYYHRPFIDLHTHRET